jgi:uncharacterized membrane protein
MTNYLIRITALFGLIVACSGTAKELEENRLIVIGAILAITAVVEWTLFCKKAFTTSYNAGLAAPEESLRAAGRQAGG